MNGVFCPLSADWGSVSDWFTVAVGVVSAIGVIYLGVKANAIGKASNHLAEVVAATAESQRARQERVLLNLLMADINAIKKTSSVLKRTIEEGVSREDFDSREDFRNYVAKETDEIQLGGLLEFSDRLHVLTGENADDIPRLIGDVNRLHTVVDSFRPYGNEVRELQPEFFQKAFDSHIGLLDRVVETSRSLHGRILPLTDD